MYIREVLARTAPACLEVSVMEFVVVIRGEKHIRRTDLIEGLANRGWLKMPRFGSGGQRYLECHVDVVSRMSKAKYDAIRKELGNEGRWVVRRPS